MNSYDTLIIGTGCAALKCADELCHMGRKSLAILTDDERAGTSRNAGSDKQTYYKLTLSGFDGDSVGEMARTLFSGGCVDGTHALCEAALSAPCFLRLCELGVPFPTNRYGEYIGYKTDHDPRRRATSAGPLTSKMMAEALDKSVRAAGVPILNHRLVVSIATQNRRVNGVVCLNTETGAFELYAANHIVWATGGPAAAYLNVSYPLAQSGMTGALLEAGAAAVNLTEWQYGLASIAPRWNVSGTYMQALPAFISTDRNGGDAREFLDGCFAAPGEALTAVFLKGYQWPFDARKAKAGSSRIDLLVQNEIARGRRVFLDFRVNPFGDRFALSALEDEAKDYLLRAGATQDTPFARLLHMNAPAVDFYRSHGVDLAHDRLEIAVCAQHMNGGIAVDEWWQSGLSGLYVIGEAAGTHGVYRPGGSALNAGQAGAARAARAISRAPEQAPAPLDEADALNAVRRVAAACRGNTSNLDALNTENAARMSACAGAVRRPEAIRTLLEDTTSLLQHFEDAARYHDERELGTLFRLRDALITRRAMLTAMLDYVAHGGGNRGSAIYEPEPRNAADLTGQVQEVCLTENSVVCRWRAVKPIPEEDDFFENVWREYRQGKW